MPINAHEDTTSARVEVKQLGFRYRMPDDEEKTSAQVATSDQYAIQDISFSLAAGELLLIAGPSGYGKSTLLKCLNGLIPRSYHGTLTGEIRFGGHSTRGLSLRDLAHYVGTMLQDPDKQIIGSIVEQEIAFGLENLGTSHAEMQLHIQEVLQRLHLEPYRQRATHALSGGQRQQVAMDLSQQHIFSHLPFFHFIGKPPFVAPGVLVISVEGITFVITQLMRNVSIGLFVIPVTYTIDPAQMGVAFRGMGISDNISYAIDLSLRFLPSVTRDFTTTYDAQRARGFEIDKLRGGIFAKIARLAPMIVPVIIGSIVDAEDIINAMELRCFGVGKRTWLIQLHPRRIDLFLIITALFLLVVVTVLNILGNFTLLPGIYFLHTQGIPPVLVAR